MTSFIRCLPLSMLRTGIMTLTLGGAVSLGNLAREGSSGKDVSQIIFPPMSRVLTSQSCTEDVPLIFNRLPVLAEYVMGLPCASEADAMIAANVNARPNGMMYFM